MILSEGDLKSVVQDYLQVQQNQGKLIFLQLFSGNLIFTNSDDSYRRRVRGCAAGTADYIVTRSAGDSPACIQRLVDFIELKSARGRQTPEQKEFQRLVEAQGCGYHIIKSLEELQKIIPLTS